MGRFVGGAWRRERELDKRRSVIIPPSLCGVIIVKSRSDEGFM